MPGAQCPPALALRDERRGDPPGGGQAGPECRPSGKGKRPKNSPARRGLDWRLTGDAAVSLSDPKAIGTALDAPSLPGMTGAERLQPRRYY